jgi:hypothetical protein
MNTSNLAVSPISVTPYIIGESPLEGPNGLETAARNAYYYGILPKVSSNSNHITKTAMERYVSLYLKIAVENNQVIYFSQAYDNCKCDVLFSLGPNDEYYLGVQIKTTQGSFMHNGRLCWAFSHLDKDYDGLLIILHSIEDAKTWLIPHRQLRNKYKGQDLFIYVDPKRKVNLDLQQFEVKPEDIAVTLHQNLSTMQSSNWLSPIKLIDAMIPITTKQQVENRDGQKSFSFWLPKP